MIGLYNKFEKRKYQDLLIKFISKSTDLFIYMVNEYKHNMSPKTEITENLLEVILQILKGEDLPLLSKFLESKCLVELTVDHKKLILNSLGNVDIIKIFSMLRENEEERRQFEKEKENDYVCKSIWDLIIYLEEKRFIDLIEKINKNVISFSLTKYFKNLEEFEDISYLIKLPPFKLLLKSQKINLTKILIDAFSEWSYECIEPIIKYFKEKEPDALKKELIENIEKCEFHKLHRILDYIDHLEKEDLIDLLTKKDSNLFDIILSKIRKLEKLTKSDENFFIIFVKDYLSFIPNKSVKNKIITTLENNNYKDFILILKFHFLESFNSEELIELFKNPKINFANKLAKIINKKEDRDIEIVYFICLIYNIIHFVDKKLSNQILEEIYRDEFKETLKNIIKTNSDHRLVKCASDLFKYLRASEEDGSLDYVILNRRVYRPKKGGLSIPKFYGVIRNICDLESLENITRLKRLYLQNHEISDLTGLEKLSELTVLDLHGNKIKEINGIDNLINLKKLDLSSNDITEIKGLEKLSNIELLWLQNNQIRELQGLENLTKLKSLNLGKSIIQEDLLNELGGLDKLGFAIFPQKFVEYCRIKKKNNL